MTPTREQLLECGSITVVMQRYRMRHSRALELLSSHGIDFGHSNTMQRNAEAARKRKAVALKLRRMKSQGVSDAEAARLLDMPISQIRITRREYEIGHTDERKKRG